MLLKPNGYGEWSLLVRSSLRARNHTRPALMAALVLAFLCTGNVAGSAGAAPLTALGVPRAYEGAVAHIWPNGINPAGTVTGYVLRGTAMHGFVRAANGTITTFDVPGAGTGSLQGDIQGTFALAINPAGTVTGSYTDGSSVSHGFVRASDGTIITFDAPGGNTYPDAINPAGTVAGTCDEASASHGFLRAADGTITTFDPGDLPYVASINPAGTVTGSFAGGGDKHGFVRTVDGTITTFDAGFQLTSPSAIDPAGTVTGWFYDGADVHGFVRAVDGNITTFGPPGVSTDPTAINAEGSIAGTYGDASGVHGFVRAAGGTITTFDAGHNTAVTAINPAGTVTGYVVDANYNPVYGFVRKANGTITTFDGSTGPHTPALAAGHGDDALVSSKVRFVSVARAGSVSTLEYSLPVASGVSLAVYDVAGRRVAVLEQGPRSAGVHRVSWGAKGVASGVYFYRLQAGSVTVTESVIILR